MELSYKELQEQGVFDVPYKAFEFMSKQQAEIDKLRCLIDNTLLEMKNQLGDEDYYDMERPDYDAMLYALRNIKDILKGATHD